MPYRSINPFTPAKPAIKAPRWAEDKFFIVSPGATGIRDFKWIQRHIPDGAFAVLTDVTSAYTMLAVMGPKARDLLAGLTDADLSSAAFPFAAAREIDVAYARPLAIRMSFVGELGWELFIPSECSANVFDALEEEGQKYDLKLVGLHALDSLRLEKGYKHWGADIAPDNTPFEAGLGFCVKMAKDAFIGKDALVRQKKGGLTKKLVMFSIQDAEPLVYHDEPIYRNGESVKFVVNPFDEYGLEEAVRIVEKTGGEVVVVTVGKEAAAKLNAPLALDCIG